MKNLRLVLALSAIAGATLLTSSAMAGAYFNNTVTVGSIYFRGAPGAARFSGDTKQQITCYNLEFSGSPYGYCYATDAAGNAKGCTADGDQQREAIRSINSESAYLSVYFDNSTGYCTSIGVSHRSADME